MEEFLKATEENIVRNLVNLRQLVFEVTDSCNLRCKYCGYSDLYSGYDERENFMFPFERAKMVIDYLFDFWCKGEVKGVIRPIMISFYGGEPLLNMEFIRKVIGYIESLPPIGKLFKYGMTTNAMLLDRYMDFLVEKKFYTLISLDGDEKGQSYRVDHAGINSFNRVYKNIELLRGKYPDYFETNVNFNSVIHNRNGVDSVCQFVKEKFDKMPRISALNTSGIRKDKIEEFNRTYCNVSKSIQQSPNCEALQKELFIRNPKTNQVLDCIRQYSGNVYNNYSQLLFDTDKVERYPTGTCAPFAKKMFVTVKGRILQCEKINHEFSLGVVTDEGVELDLEQAAEQHNKYAFKYIRQCDKCARRKSCKLCVFEVDDLCQDDSPCAFFSTQDDISRDYSNAMAYLDKHPELYKRILKEVIIRG